LRLAILADIHGNLQALEAVLEDIQKQAVDRVIISGDMVNRGPNNVAVMERVLNKGYSLLLGNHDDFLRQLVERRDLPEDYFSNPFWEANHWSARQLQRANKLASLANLPMTLRLEQDGLPSLLISHGSPRHYREGYSEYLPEDTLSEIIQMHPADIYIGSHTHSQLKRSWGQHQIYNTGAVGAPFNHDQRAQYLLLTAIGGNWQVEFRRLNYDHQAALKAFATTGLLAEGGLSAHIFYQELKQARSLLTPFWIWTEKQSLAQSWDSWQQYQALSGLSLA
jgi:predicted phosphodiesterase